MEDFCSNCGGLLGKHGRCIAQCGMDSLQDANDVYHFSIGDNVRFKIGLLQAGKFVNCGTTATVVRIDLRMLITVKVKVMDEPPVEELFLVYAEDIEHLV